MENKFEIWNKNSSGILSEEPLLLSACKAGNFGSVFSYSEGCVCKALFTYLCGKPDKRFFAEHQELFYGNWLVCMSTEWENFIKSLNIQIAFRRELMAPLCAESQKQLKPLPEGYSITPFTQAVFEAHPFDHGKNYKDFQDFSKTGVGAAVLYGGKVVAAASSFLTYNGHVELDISTDPEHQKRGLAGHCTAEVMRQCCQKKLTMHWDAQNPISASLAKSHGFKPLTEYAVYSLVRKAEVSEHVCCL